MPNIKAVDLMVSEKKSFVYFFIIKTYTCMLPLQPEFQFDLHKNTHSSHLGCVTKYLKLALVPGHVICKSLMLHLNLKTKDILTLFHIQMHRRRMLTLA